MGFKDSRIIHIGSYKFEHARIVQGTIIYLVLFFLTCLAAFNRYYKEVIVIVAIVLFTYAVLTLYYLHKGENVRTSFLLALIRLVTLPTSMIG